MTTISSNYLNLLADVDAAMCRYGRDPAEITVVAVSKQQPLESLLEVYSAGCRHFGENRIPEADLKREMAPHDIHWHFIGSLQKNKVNKVVDKYALVHSVDSIELAKKMNERSRQLDCRTPALLEVNMSGEPAKHGFQAEALTRSFEELLKLEHMEWRGLMTMAPFVHDEHVVRGCFANLRILRDRLSSYTPLPELSMGMSNDYRWAIAEGATLLRVGSLIFNKDV